MKFKLSAVFATLCISVIVLFSACQDEDFGYTEQEIKTSKFAKNFLAEYGALDPDQSWDLTTFKYRTSKYNDETLLNYALNNSMTRAGSYNPIGTLPDNLNDIEIDDEGYYHVQPNTIKWLRSYLKEGKNNTNLGSAFSLRAPSNKIAIIPIYQGFANMDWSLWINHNGEETQLWKESENIKVSNDGGSTWTTKGTTYGTSQTVYDLAIKAKPVVVDLGSSSVKEFNLFLKIDNNNGQNNNATTGTKQLSSMGMMLALPCPLPDNLGQTASGEENLAMIVGCEDSDLSNSDWDMNDVCFLIVGFPNLPNRIDITRKRYMCEDLGNTYDFDFNDIVVDVMEVITSEYDSESNLFKPKGDPTQIATLKHVCGTLPFQVKVGNTSFNTVTDPTDEEKTIDELKKGETDLVDLPQTRAVNWNPEISKKVTGWNHKTNNIEIYVSTTKENNGVLADAFGDKNGNVTEDGDKHIYKITFNEDPGDAPLIIATDPTLNWMDEHVHIPVAWWKEGTFKPTGTADNDTPSGGGTTIDPSWKEIPEHLVTPDADGNVVIWDAADHVNASNNKDKGIFEGWTGLQFQTEFLDALFEGYNIIEFQFGNGNTAETFRLCKVTNNWDTVIATPTISNGKASYTFSSTALTDYSLGVAIMNIGDSGKKMVLSKVVMKQPQSYTLTVNNGDHGTVSISPAPTDGKYADGTEVTLTVTPADGWFFDKWSDGNKTNPRKVTVSSNLELTALYSDYDTHIQDEGNVELNRTETTLTDWSNSILIERNDFHEGDVIVVKVKNISAGAQIGLKADYKEFYVESVSGDIAYTLTSADAQAINNAKKLRIQGKNVTVTSVTKRCSHTSVNSYSVSAAKGENCNSATLSANKSAVDGKYEEGTEITLTATPADEWNYIFLGWFKDGATTPASTNEEYNFTLSSANAGTYTAKYEKKIESYTLGNSAINFKLKDGNYAVTMSAPTIDSGKTYRLTLNFSGINQSSAKIKIYQIDNSWGWGNVKTESLVLNGSNGTYTVDFTSNENVFGAHGIAIQRATDDNNSNIVFVNATIEDITASGGNDAGGAIVILNSSTSANWGYTEVNPGSVDFTGKTKVTFEGSVSNQYVRICENGNKDNEGKTFSIGDGNRDWTTNKFTDGKITVSLSDDLKTILSEKFYVAGCGTITKITVE